MAIRAFRNYRVAVTLVVVRGQNEAAILIVMELAMAMALGGSSSGNVVTGKTKANRE